MILPSLWILLGILKSFKCSEIDQTIRTPLMIGATDELVSLNHLNVILQSLYHLSPLRKSVFKPVLSFDAPTLSPNPLELIFAKMHYDFEKGNGPTDASIYFKDSYLRNPLYESTDPNLFFSWIFENSIGFDSIRDLIQWELASVKRTIETGSEVTVSEYSEIISVNPDTKKNSLQAYLDNKHFDHKLERVSVVSDGDFIERTVESRTEIVRDPTIAVFQLPKSLDAWPESTLVFNVEPKLTLSSDKSYNLVAVILYDPQESRFSVCLETDSTWWYRVQDDSVQRVSKDSVLVSAAKFGYMAFYLDSSVASAAISVKSSESPKPSRRLIMESLTKNTLHAISKTIQRRSNNNNSSPSSLYKSANLSHKSKNMPPGMYSEYALNVSGDISPYGTFRSTSVLSLPSLPSKTPPPIEFEQMRSILVPTDLSNTKLYLITTGSFNQADESLSDDVDAVKAGKLFSEDFTKTRASSIDDDFDANFHDEKDVYFEYFEDSPRKSNSGTWATNYLNTETKSPQIRRTGKVFTELMNFEFEFATAPEEPAGKEMHSANTNFDEEKAADLFLQASLAHIKKLQLKDQHGEFDCRDIEMKPLSFKERSKKSSKFKSAHDILTQGLFYRNSKGTSVLPVSSSEDTTLSKSEDDSYETKQKEQIDKDTKKDRYSTF